MELQDRQLAGNKESLLREKPHHWTYEFNTVYWTEIYLKGVLPCVKALYELQASFQNQKCSRLLRNKVNIDWRIRLTVEALISSSERIT